MRIATIGFFDGVHKGHQFLLRQVVEEAEHRGGISIVVTFANHPITVVTQNTDVQLLTTIGEKTDLLLHYGIKEVKILDFTAELACKSAYEFMKNTLRDEMNIDVLVIGYDHRFGHNRLEGFEEYVKYGNKIGIDVIQAQEYKENYITISSSLIRDELLQGRVNEIPQLLGYNYFIEGSVVGGFQIGRNIGYPTANIKVETQKLIPCDGVYAVIAKVDEKKYGGMLNIGCRPTFDNGKRSIEVNLFDFGADIYSERIRIYFIGYLRSEKKFSSVKELIVQLSIDESNAKKFLLYNPLIDLP